jgi:hypothetical protein
MKKYAALILLLSANTAFAQNDTRLFNMLADGGPKSNAWYNAHPQVERCIDEKINLYRKENGELSVVTAGMSAEWAVECYNASKKQNHRR